MSKQHVSVLTAPFSYTKYRGVAPHGYKCRECGAVDVKLWREWNTFLDHQVLRCVKCICGATGEAVPKYLSDRESGSDQFTHPVHGSLAPAIPTEDGQSYWGYTSAPALGVIWWKRLDSPKWSAVEILRDYHQSLDARTTFERALSEVTSEDSRAYYQRLLDDVNRGIDAIWLDVQGRTE